jgi:hypothetical protein
MKRLVTRAARVAYVFVMMNLASLQALVAITRGRTHWR